MRTKKRQHKKYSAVTTPSVRINGQIRAQQVRLISNDGEQKGMVSIQEAIAFAEEAGLDLVEVSHTPDATVCKIMDYSKYIFRTKKSKAKKTQKHAEQKTIKFRPNTSQSDYEIKKRKITDFLSKGHRIKVIIWFRGREIMHQDLGRKMIEKIKIDLESEIRIDDEPKVEGRQISMAISPLLTKKQKTT